MIIREGINVKYSHDDEALLVWMGSLREFSGMETRLPRWLNKLRHFGTCATYYHYVDEEWPHFWSHIQVAQAYLPREKRDELTRVELWNPQETARHLLEKHGFSCVCCGVRCSWRGVPGPGLHGLHDLLRSRQTIQAPPLVCLGCASVLFLLSGRMHVAPEYAEGMINDLLARVVPGIAT